ncbi:MAG: LacI family DNA-binding transcriptional regulator [Peptostreptococcaceae bacterium]
MATMKDVAKLAGVGLGTVSRVINKNESVKESTRLKVEKAIEELNFVPNEIARTLKVSQSKTIALILPTIWHPFFSEFAYYVEENSYKKGFKLILCNSSSKKEKEIEYIEMLKQNKVDGIITITYNDIDKYVSSKLPIVSIDRHFSEDVAYVTSDNYEGGKLAVSKLLENNCKKIAFMGTHNERQTDVDNRRKGFEEECIIKKLNYEIFDKEEKTENLEKEMEKFIKENIDIDGIFTINDFFGLKVMKILEKLDIKVPQDVRVIGYDGAKMSYEQSFIMSTIRQPVEEMAKEAVEILFSILKGESDIKKVKLPVKYIKGDTTIL